MHTTHHGIRTHLKHTVVQLCARLSLSHSLLAMDLQTTCVFGRPPRIHGLFLGGELTGGAQQVSSNFEALVLISTGLASIGPSMFEQTNSVLMCFLFSHQSITLRNDIETNLCWIMWSATSGFLLCAEYCTGYNKGIKNYKTLVSVLKMFEWQNDVWKCSVIWQVSSFYEMSAQCWDVGSENGLVWSTMKMTPFLVILEGFFCCCCC